MPRFHQREQLTSPDTSLTLRKLIPLPLKVTVKFNIHKALSSLAKFAVENDGASEVHVAGKLHGQTQSKYASCCRKAAWSNSIKRCIQE
mgnify:CR=1 FL=1